MKSRRLSYAASMIPMVAVLTFTGCGGGAHSDSSSGPAEGYVRYEVAPVTLQPGESGMWIQWVAAPFDRDRNVVDLTGHQGKGGHHAVLYTTTEIQPIGTTRVFANEDQTAMHFVGGVGGETGGALKLPAGVVFRLPAGRALVLQTHYINTTDKPIQGTSSVDVKYGDPSPNDTVASFFVHTPRGVNVPPRSDSKLDSTCVLAKDLRMLMFTNHMHEMGAAVTTTLAEAGGAPTVLKEDKAWNPEWAFNPDYTRTAPDAPIVLRAGATISTHCEWHNTGDKALESPDEMCIFLGFFLGDKDVTCLSGTWME
jgi:hypothetical protein